MRKPVTENAYFRENTLALIGDLEPPDLRILRNEGQLNCKTYLIRL